MKFKTLIMLSCALGLTCTIQPVRAQAQDHIHLSHGHMNHNHDKAHHHKGPQAPIGVMGDHMHERGEWMISYRFMHMDMDGNRDGTNSLSPEEIATTIPNRFSGVAGQPPTLRVVPTEMTMQMHMLGAMYAPSDWLTLIAMANYQDKEMDHITFSGGTGTTRLGEFTTNAKGFGDTKITGLVRLYNDNIHHVHLNAGLSLPTGSIDETDTVLAPNNTTPTLRLPYAMQLGTGTFDIHPGLTYTGYKHKIGWGIQYKAEIRLEDENDEGYAWGDKHQMTAWSGYQWNDWLGTTARITATTQDEISGIDPNIVAPVQTADPDNFGGETVYLGFGANFTGTHGALEDKTFGIEASLPLYRDLNGPQMETDFILTAGFKVGF